VIARWPGQLKPGTTNETRVSSIDFLPTFAALVGAPIPAGLDGKDLSAAFVNNEVLDRGNLYWHYPHYHATRPSGSILSGDWKLIEWFETGKTELYNLATDPGEQKDLATENPEKAAALLTELKKWRAEVGAQMMKENPQYDPARETEKPPKKVNKKREQAKSGKNDPANRTKVKKEKKPKAEKAAK
jgi:arylsulfatase A